jgi:glycosyltransferase involved in cell wall biosynthesis
MSAPSAGFNFFAFISGNFGLATAARHTLAWLLSQSQSVCLRDSNTRDGRSGQDHSYDALVTRRRWGLPYDVNLFHLNPPELCEELAHEWRFLPVERRMNAMVPFWELPSLPPLWRDALAAMDLVLAPTRFVQTIVEANVPGARTLHFPIVIPGPAPARPDRARFGLPEHGLVFLSAFDVTSDVHRKNPWAAIAAFQAAFTAQEPVRLVIKLNNANLLPEVRPFLDRLRRVAADDRRVVLIDQHLSQPDLYGLYASCDVFVSLHRAEGLGLILMEMMSLGKPVIATAWSGNMDFTNPDNACLVDYDMVPVQATHATYQEESARSAVLWADPHVATAVAWMRRLYAEPGLRARIGQQAAQDMQCRAGADRSDMLADIRRVLSSPDTQASHRVRAQWLLRRRIEGLARSFQQSPRSFWHRVGAMLCDVVKEPAARSLDPRFRI